MQLDPLILNKTVSFVRWVFVVSRPRIWAYTAGPFFFGFLFWYHNLSFLLTPSFYTLFLWLLLPANLFVYAINDAFDYETDLHNPRKQGFESRSSLGDTGKLLLIAAIAALTFVPFFIEFPVPLKIVSIVWFLLLITYNVPPLRLKTIPGADLLSSFNYYLWGVTGYYLASGQFPILTAWLLMALFGVAMHIYTSSSDIVYDKQAGIRTISTTLGSTDANLAACVALCAAILGIAYLSGAPNVSFTVGLYLAFFLAQLSFGSEQQSFKWHRYFIGLHYIAGCILATTLI